MSISKPLAAGLVAILLSGCSGCETKTKTINCTDPVNNQTITNADDINATTPGIQISVVCSVRGFGIGDRLQLTVTDEDSNDRFYTLPYDGTGEVEFTPVTFQGGTATDPEHYSLLATGDDGDVESNTVEIDVIAEGGTCPEFDFIDPTDGDSWNQDDDANSDPSDGFQHDVIITTTAGDSESVSLYLNSALVGTGTVDGTRIEFADVTFPSGGGDMTLRIQTTTACYAEATVTIDDESPVCRISAPVPTDPAGWINATFDTSTSAGMQADITVESEDSAAIELFVDVPITEPPTLTGTASASGAYTFSAVPLAESAFGDLTLQVRCTDTMGNPGVSSLNSYGVDSILPVITITSPTGGEYYNDDSDVNTSIAGVQVNVSVTSDQPSTSVELYVCSSTPAPLIPEGVPTTDTTGSATGQVSLGGVDGSVDICASVTKISGNTGTAGPVTVHLDTNLPQVRITDPATTSPPFAILISNDMSTTTPGAQWTVEVECDSIGGTVELFANGVSIASPIACIVDSGSSLGGSATFTLVTIPEGAVTLTAEHVDLASNSNISAGVPIEVDTEAPTLAFLSPSCGTVFHASGSYTTAVRVNSSDSPVTLTVTNGGSPVGGSPYTEPTTMGGFANFASVEFAQGTNTAQACSTDDHGQSGCTSTCTITVQDLPFVSITSPADGTLLGTPNDIDTGTPGLQVNVTVLSDVVAGITVTLEVNGTPVGSMAYVVGGVTFTNITLPEGTSVIIRATATDTRGTGEDTNTVRVDITPPTATITGLAITVQSRRGGDIRLSWTAPSDGGSAVANYDIRCSPSNITSDTEFNLAPSYPFGGVPGAPGSSETADIYDLTVGVGTQYYCAVKSLDAAGNKSPMSNVPSTALAYQSHVINGESGTAYLFGINNNAAGDVNGDTIEDFVIGSNGARAYLYLGTGSGSLPTTPSVIFTGPTGSYFGAYVAGIGNFDGDGSGLSDIVIGSWGANGNKGAVYLFTGRTSWPSTIAHTSASLTFVMEDPSSAMDDSALLGASLSPAGDFNGDGRNDFVANAFGWNANRGASFIILGRTGFTPGTSINVPGDRTTGFIGDFMITGSGATDRFGISSSHLGRVNGDTRDDIVIGARDASTSGTASVFFGRTSSGSGLADITSASQTIASPDAGANRFGYHTAGPGDINGDGRPDLIVGAPWYSTSVGRIYVFYNASGTGFSTTPDVTITNGSSATSGDYFGYTLGKGNGLNFYTDGNMNGTGPNDLVYFSYTYGAESGKAFLDYGGSLASGSSSAADVTFPFAGTDPGGILSYGSLLGDINNDGFCDLAIGFYTYSSNLGTVHIYY